MTQQVIEVRFHGGDDLETLIEEEGGQILPYPETFPPFIIAQAKQATIEKIKTYQDVKDVVVKGPVN